MSSTLTDNNSQGRSFIPDLTPLEKIGYTLDYTTGACAAATTEGYCYMYMTPILTIGFPACAFSDFLKYHNNLPVLLYLMDFRISYDGR